MCQFKPVVLKVCLGNRHLCPLKGGETNNIRKRETWSSGGQGWEKESTAWKGGKQFHANKGWTIGELSVSFPPPSAAVPLSPSQSQGRAFSTGIKRGEGWGFFADYWMLFEAFPKGWSYSEKGFLFLWCSSIIHRPLYGLVSALEGLPKPGCIWIISLWYSPSGALHPQCRGYWR